MSVSSAPAGQSYKQKRLAEFQQAFKFVLGTGIEPILQD